MFTNALLLWFLPLALVPILLHLLTLFRIRTVELSTYRFLMDSYVQQRWRVKLLEYLLMFLRAAFVALVVFAVGRPVVQQFGFLFGGETGRDVTIILDASATMALRTGGRTSLERAQDAANVVVDLLGKEDHVTVIRAGRRPETWATGFASLPETVRRKIASIEPDATSGDISLALAEALAAPAHGPRLICILSDGGRPAWSNVEDHPGLRDLDAEIPVVVMDVGATESVANLAVVGESPRSIHAVLGLPVLLEATVLNCSEKQATNSVLSVILDDERVDQANVSLQPGQTATVPFTVAPTRAGLIRGRFSLPTDGFPDDDEFLFCLNVEPHLEVLVVTGARKGDPAQRAEHYINAALASPLKAGSTAPETIRLLATARSVSSVKLRQLTASKLDQADVVILADATAQARHLRLLRDYVEAGGGLLVFPEAWVKRRGSARSPRGARPVLGFSGQPKFGAPRGNPDDETTFASIGRIDLLHPVLSAFDEPELEAFSTVRLYRYFPIELPRGNATEGVASDLATGPVRVLMRLPDGSPILVESSVGQGKLLLAGFASTPSWSNLPVKSEYVPLLLRAVAYLRRPASAEAQPSVRPHMPATLHLTERWSDARVQAIDPSGKPHTIELHRTGRRWTGALLETGRKGYYSFVVYPETKGAPERVELGFAVNLDTNVNHFERLDEEEIRRVLSPVKPVYLSGSPDDPVLKSQLTQRREIWRFLIWVLFVVIAVEFLLATLRPSRQKAVNGGRMKENRRGMLIQSGTGTGTG